MNKLPPKLREKFQNAYFNISNIKKDNTENNTEENNTHTRVINPFNGSVPVVIGGDSFKNTISVNTKNPYKKGSLPYSSGVTTILSRKIKEKQKLNNEEKNLKRERIEKMRNSVRDAIICYRELDPESDLDEGDLEEIKNWSELDLFSYLQQFFPTYKEKLKKQANEILSLLDEDLGKELVNDFKETKGVMHQAKDWDAIHEVHESIMTLFSQYVIENINWITEDQWQSLKIDEAKKCTLITVKQLCEKIISSKKLSHAIDSLMDALRESFENIKQNKDLYSLLTNTEELVFLLNQMDSFGEQLEKLENKIDEKPALLIKKNLLNFLKKEKHLLGKKDQNILEQIKDTDLHGFQWLVDSLGDIIDQFRKDALYKVVSERLISLDDWIESQYKPIYEKEISENQERESIKLIQESLADLLKNQIAFIKHKDAEQVVSFFNQKGYIVLSEIPEVKPSYIKFVISSKVLDFNNSFDDLSVTLEEKEKFKNSTVLGNQIKLIIDCKLKWQTESKILSEFDWVKQKQELLKNQQQYLSKEKNEELKESENKGESENLVESESEEIIEYVNRRGYCIIADISEYTLRDIQLIMRNADRYELFQHIRHLDTIKEGELESIKNNQANYVHYEDGQKIIKYLNGQGYYVVGNMHHYLLQEVKFLMKNNGPLLYVQV